MFMNSDMDLEVLKSELYILVYQSVLPGDYKRKPPLGFKLNVFNVSYKILKREAKIVSIIHSQLYWH